MRYAFVIEDQAAVNIHHYTLNAQHLSTKH